MELGCTLNIRNFVLLKIAIVEILEVLK